MVGPLPVPVVDVRDRLVAPAPAAAAEVRDADERDDTLKEVRGADAVDVDEGAAGRLVPVGPLGRPPPPVPAPPPPAFPNSASLLAE